MGRGATKEEKPKDEAVKPPKLSAKEQREAKKQAEKEAEEAAAKQAAKKNDAWWDKYRPTAGEASGSALGGASAAHGYCGAVARRYAALARRHRRGNRPYRWKLAALCPGECCCNPFAA